MSTNRSFRFSVQIQGTPDGPAWRDRMRKAEALGYDTVHMADHFGGQFGIMPALAIAAEVTTTLRLGQLVLQNDLRHPALLAKDIATLDLLSNGRMELGIGAGGSYPPDFSWTGIPFDPPATRVSRLEESVTVLKGLFAEEPFSFAGEHYTITDYNGLPKPLQKPHPPVLIGAGSPRMLRLAAKEADIIGVLPALSPDGEFDLKELTVPGFRAKVDRIREIAPDRFDQIELNSLTQVFEITDKPAEVLEGLLSDWQPGQTEWQPTPFVLVGTPQSIADDLRGYRESIGFTYFTLRDNMMDAFAPVIPLLK